MVMGTSKITGTGILPAAIIGTLSAVGVSVFVMLVQPFLIFGEYLKPDSIQILATATQLIAVFAGTFIAISIVNDKRYIVAALCSGIFILILLCTGLLFFDGLTSWAIAGVLGSVTGAGCAVLLRQRKKGAKNRRKNKRHHR